MMSEIRHEAAAPTAWSVYGGGARIDRHRHDEHQLVCVTTGVLAVETPAGQWVSGPGRGVWVPAGIWHQHRFYGASSFHTVGYGQAHPSALPTDRPVVVAVNALAREVIAACTDAAVSAGARRRLLAVLDDQLQPESDSPAVVAAPADPRLRAACALVTEDLRHPRTLGQLAVASHTAQRTLSRLFRDEMGQTYPQWRNDVRVFHARIDLARGYSITETAVRCGWATPSAFIDSFRRAVGQTPRAYQRSVRRS